MSFLSKLFGSKNEAEPEELSTTPVTAPIDETDELNDFIDISLLITDKRQEDGYIVYTAQTQYNDTAIGLQIAVKNNMPNGIVYGQIDAENGFIRDAMRFSSIGTESDAFIATLSELYKQPVAATFNPNNVSCTVFSMNAEPVDLDRPFYYQFKAFFEEDNDELYSELYVNINTVDNTIELSEKDVEYRPALVKIFSGQ
jgi:hypothetical protein